MTDEQKARFKELWTRFWAGQCSKEEAHEFAVLTTFVPINLQTGKIPLLEEVASEQRRVRKTEATV